MPRERKVYYGRLYGSFHDDRRRARVSLAADGLWVRALARAIDENSDGWVADGWLRAQVPARQRAGLLAEIEREQLLEPFHAGDVRELANVGAPLAGQPVTVGPFDEDGWLIHDFLENQLSSVQRAAQSEAARRRAQASRTRRLADRVAALVTLASRVTCTARAPHVTRDVHRTSHARHASDVNVKDNYSSLNGSRKDRPARVRATARRSEGAGVGLFSPLIFGGGWLR